MQGDPTEVLSQVNAPQGEYLGSIEAERHRAFETAASVFQAANMIYFLVNEKELPIPGHKTLPIPGHYQ